MTALRRLLFRAVPLGILLPAGLLAQTIRPEPVRSAADLDAFVTQALEQYSVPGAVVAVVRDGKTVFVKGYGVRDVSTGAPVNADTVFPLASISKSFAGAAFAAQVAQGKADWDKPVGKVLKGFKMADGCATEMATPLDFLVHRSGLPAFEGDVLERLGFSRGQIMQRLRLIKPGYSFRDHPEYNNLGFLIAGEVTAKLAGKPWEQALEELILKPAGMLNTGLSEDMAKRMPNFAQPHALNADHQPMTIVPRLQRTLAAAGGIGSTGKDMAAFATFLLGGGKPTLNEEALARLFEPVIGSPPGFTEMPPISVESGFAYSPGWGVYFYDNTKFVEKGGALDGYRTILTLVPEHKLGIVVLCNRNLTAFPEAVRAEIIAREFGGPAAQWQEKIKEAADQIDEMFAGIEPPEEAKPTPRPLAAFAGTYTSPLYGEWTIHAPAKDGAPLTVTAGPAKLAGTLRPWDGDTLLLQWENSHTSLGTDCTFKTKGEAITGFTYNDRDAFKRTTGKPETK